MKDKSFKAFAVLMAIMFSMTVSYAISPLTTSIPSVSSIQRDIIWQGQIGTCGVRFDDPFNGHKDRSCGCVVMCAIGEYTVEVTIKGDDYDWRNVVFAHYVLRRSGDATGIGKNTLQKYMRSYGIEEGIRMCATMEHWAIVKMDKRWEDMGFSLLNFRGYR